MKALTTLALSVALAGGSIAAQAEGQADRDLALCKAELRGIYGEDTELNLVDRRRNQHGTRMRVAARLDADNSYFANCWVARYDEGEFELAEDNGAVAATDMVVGSR